MSSEVAVREEHTAAVYTGPKAQSARFSDPVGRHLRKSFDDYTVSKLHIMQAIGDISTIQLFGRQVLCAVFCRPNFQTIKKWDGTETQFYTPVKEIKEDWYQHKVVLVLKMGPDAFKGEPSYMQATFGDDGPPQPGDWLFANASAGIQVHIGDDETASRPQAVDMNGAPMDIYEWDGWPCRVISDESFYGRLLRPQSVV